MKNIMETRQGKEVAPDSPEGDSVCLICRRLYQDINKNKSLFDPSTLLHFQNIFDSVSKYLSAEIFENCFQWDFAEEKTSPLCSDCFVYMEKIFKICQRLDKLQNAIENVIDSFTSEVLGHHNKLEFLYVHNKDKESQRPGEIVIKLEPEDYGSWDKNKKVYEDIQLNFRNEKSQFGEHEEDDDYGNDPLDLGSVDDFEDQDQHPQFAETAELATTDICTNEDILATISSTPNNEFNKVTTTRGITSGRTDDLITEYRGIKLKPLKIVLQRLSAVDCSASTDSVPNNKKIVQPAQNELRQLFGTEENVEEVKRPPQKRKASIKANVALKRIAGKENKNKSSKSEFTKSIREGDSSYSHDSFESDSDDEGSVNKEYGNKNSKQKVKKYKIPNYFRVVKRFKCRDKSCRREFNFGKEIESHSSKSGHVNKKKLKCKECSKCFYRKTDLNVHSKLHQKYKLWKCKHCSKKFKTVERFRIHKYRSHPAKVHNCDKCEKTFLRKINYENHIKQHKKKTFECGNCSEKFFWRLSLKIHRCKANGENTQSFSNRVSSRRHRSAYFKGKIKTWISCIACKKVHFVERAWDKCIISHFRNKANIGFVCSICGSVFQSARGLDDHSAEERHVNKKHFFCFHCLKPHYKRSDIRYHLRLHKNGANSFLYRKRSFFKCRNCPEKFRRIHLLELHKKIHTGGIFKTYTAVTCNFCGKNLLYERGLPDHMNTHTGERPHKCGMCGQDFQKVNHLNFHKRKCSVDSKKEYSCIICDSVFKNEYKFTRHLKTHKKKNIPCKLCGKVLKGRLSLAHHLKTHSALQHKCDQCDLEFNMLGKLQRHKLSTHATEEPFGCTVCDKKFKMKSNLRIHMRRHTQKRVQCDVCGNSFSNKDGLRMHKKVHTGDQLSCTFCDKKFFSRWTLKEHTQVVHTKEKTYNCGLCEKSVSSKKSLQTHLRTHTGEKPFKCAECPKTFNAKSHLNTHFSRIHSKEKLICDICGKPCSNNYDLRVHKLTHGEKKFQCEICAFACTRKDNLVTHIRSHTQEKPFVCDLCGKGFARQDNLHTHIKWHEKMKKAEEIE